MAEIQGSDCQEINAIKQSQCKRCGNIHQKEKCPAGGKKNHWAKCASTKMEAREDSPKQERHTAINSCMKIKTKSGTTESVQ